MHMTPSKEIYVYHSLPEPPRLALQAVFDRKRGLSLSLLSFSLYFYLDVYLYISLCISLSLSLRRQPLKNERFLVYVPGNAVSRSRYSRNCRDRYFVANR